MKKISIILIIISVLLFGGCSKAENPNYSNTYVEGQDNQYMYTDNIIGTKLQHSSKGYYFLHGNGTDRYLYFVDESTQKP